MTTKPKKAKAVPHYALDRTGKGNPAAKKPVDKSKLAAKPPQSLVVFNNPPPKSRAIPMPGRDTAVAVSKSVMEHVYWLGRAIKDKDKEAAQQEVDVIARFATLYNHLASNPDNQPLKMSTSDEYPNNVKHRPKSGRKNEESDEESDEEMDLEPAN
jgi:hypothetical protein